MLSSDRYTGARAPLAAGLLGIVIVFLVLGARWLWLFRHGQPVSVDESNYLAMSLSDYFDFTWGGIRGFVAAFEAHRSYAPLTSAVAAVLYGATGPHVIAAFAVPLMCAAGTIVVTYLIGVRLDSPVTGLLSAALVATCPLIVTYSRAFHFAVPATLVATMALFAAVQSERCRHWRWTLLFGLCVGLLPLTRSMTIAFLPGLVLGAMIYAAADPVQRVSRLLKLACALFLAAAVAATWLVPNAAYVFPYLVTYGYGNHAAQWGPGNPIFSLTDWLYMARSDIAYLHLPHVLVLAAGVVAVVALTARSVIRDGASATLRMMILSPALPLVVYVAEAVAALASTQNKGDAFVAPVVPAAIVIAVWGLRQLGQVMTYRRVVAGVIAAASIMALAPTLDLRWPIARPWQIDLPVLGLSLVADGRGYMQLYGGGGDVDVPADPMSRAEGKAWVDFNIAATTTILQTNGLTAWGFRHYFFDAGTIVLYEMILERRMSFLTEIDPVATGNTVDGNVTWLTKGDASWVCFLLTTDDEAGQPTPAIDSGNMITAAVQAGFRQTATWTMPNGHHVIYWSRDLPGCKGAPAAGGA